MGNVGLDDSHRGESDMTGKRATSPLGRITLVVAHALVALCLVSGCVPHSDCDHLWIAEDGSIAGCVQEDCLFSPILPSPATRNVRWTQAGDPKTEQHKIQVGTAWGMFMQGLLSGELPDVIPSPDGRHVLLVGTKTSVLELDSGKRWDVPTKEHIYYVVWLGNDEIGYVGKESGTVYRRRIHEASPEVVVFQAGKPHYSERVIWSNDCRFLVIAMHRPGSVHVVEVSSGRVVHHYPSQDHSLNEAAWAPDGTTMLLRLDREPYTRDPQRIEFRLVNMATGAVRTHTGEDIVRKDTHYVGSMLQWTADGRYVIVGVGEERGLLDTETWKVRPLTELLAAHFKVSVKDLYIGPLPLVGWIYVQHLGAAWAYNYDSGEFKLFSTHRQWAVSRDGKRIAKIDNRGNIILRDFTIPPPPSRESSMTP